MVVSWILFAAGTFAWTLAEYALHGWMSHRFVTFATPLHQVHHRDPSAVFAIGGWLPVAVVIGVLLIAFGMTTATCFILGLTAGFAIYEAVHYRLHFARPATRWEARLRTRHLAHHVAFHDRCLGVTTSLWDRIFGTEPGSAELAAVAGDVSRIEPLTGPCNLGRVFEYARAALARSVSLSGRAK